MRDRGFAQKTRSPSYRQTGIGDDAILTPDEVRRLRRQPHTDRASLHQPNCATMQIQNPSSCNCNP